MKALTMETTQSGGRILSCTIFRSCGKKLFAKGHVLSDEDIRLLENEGMRQVWVTELEAGEVGEDEAVCAVAQAMGCGSIEVRLAPGGRANLFATEDCCVLVDDQLLRQINCTASIVIATAANFSYAQAGQRIATVKSVPFAVAQEQLSEVLQAIHEQGPMLQARPIRNPVVSVLYTDPLQGERARHLFESVTRHRLERYGTAARHVMCAVEEEATVARALDYTLRQKPTLVLVASTTAPAGPEDVVGRAMASIGCQVERFLAPVEPGNLLLLAYQNDVPILSAPGCFRSAKTNVVDLVLPPMLARYRLSGWEVGSLGHGGLLA